jgi:hypothetical protein
VGSQGLQIGLWNWRYAKPFPDNVCRPIPRANEINASANLMGADTKKANEIKAYQIPLRIYKWRIVNVFRRGQPNNVSGF